jgi:CRP-like cAMP-binding protein
MRKVLYILSRLTDEDVDWMAVTGTGRRHDVGEVLIRQGEPIDALMFVLDGKVSVEVYGIGPIASLGSGEMLGEMSLVDEAPPSATVVVTQPAHVLHIDCRALNARLEAEPQFAARFYRAIAVFLSMRMRSTVLQLGYGKGMVVAEDEIELSLLDTVTLAGSRFERMIKKLLTA